MTTPTLTPKKSPKINKHTLIFISLLLICFLLSVIGTMSSDQKTIRCSEELKEYQKAELSIITSSDYLENLLTNLRYDYRRLLEENNRLKTKLKEIEGKKND